MLGTALGKIIKNSLSASGVIFIGALIALFAVCLTVGFVAFVQINSLQNSNTAVQNSLDTLQSNYDQLEKNFNIIQSNYAQLQLQYNELYSQYLQLTSTSTPTPAPTATPFSTPGSNQDEVEVKGVDTGAVPPVALAQNTGSNDVLIVSAITKDAYGNIVTNYDHSGNPKILLAGGPIFSVEISLTGCSSGQSYTVTLLSSRGRGFVSSSFMMP